MATQKTKFTVGLFVACGIVVALMAIIWLGMSRYFQEGRYYVTYFNESVQGLDRDSPVKYRGVSIGRVESISVAPDSTLIEVVMKVETGQTLGKDIVAQLKSVGITGSVFIELDRRKPGEADRSPPLRFPAKYPVVASKPAEISELLRGVDDALNQIRSLDLKGISEKVKQTLDLLNQTIRQARVGHLSNQLEASLQGLSSALDSQRWERIGKSVEETASSANAFLVRAKEGLERLESALARVDRLTAEVQEPIKGAARNLEEVTAGAQQLLEKGTAVVSRTDQSVRKIQAQLQRVGRNLEAASRNLKRLVQEVEQQPSRILFAKPPSPRRLPPDSGQGP